MATPGLYRRVSDLPNASDQPSLDSLMMICQDGVLYKTKLRSMFTYAYQTLKDMGLTRTSIATGPGILPYSGKALKVDRSYLDQLLFPLDTVEMTIVGNLSYSAQLPFVANGKIWTLNDSMAVLLNHKTRLFQPGEISIDFNDGGINAAVDQYVYLDGSTPQISVIYSTELLPETYTRTCIAKVWYTSVVYWSAPTFSRLGLYRLNATPRGAAVPVNTGSPAQAPKTTW